MCLASSIAIETTASTSSLDVDLVSTTSQRRTWRLKPSVRRQARLELDVPSASNNLVNGAAAASAASAASAAAAAAPSSIADSTSPSGSRDHGLRTPPGPPSVPPPSTISSSSTSSISHARQSIGVRRPTTLHQDESISQNR